MDKFLGRVRPADVIGVIVIIGGIWLKHDGADGTVTALLTAVIFYYFGSRVSEFKKSEL